MLFHALGYYSAQTASAANISVQQNPDPVCQDSGKYTLTFMGSAESTFVPNENYTLGIWKYKEGSNDLDRSNFYSYLYKSADGKILTSAEREKAITIIGQRANIGPWHYKLWFGKGTGVLEKEPNRLLASGDFTLFPKEACGLGLPILEMSSPIQIGTVVPIKVRNINPASDYLLWFIDGQVFVNGKFPASSVISETIKDGAGNEKNIKTAAFSVTLDNNPGFKTLCLKHGSTTLGFGKNNCEISIPIEITISSPQISPTTIQSSQPNASLQESPLFSEPDNLPIVLPPCAEYKDGKCLAIDTAIGRINTNPAEFVKFIFSRVLGIAGGIALILLMISGYKMMASQGNPEQITAARDQLLSAIIGLLFIILSFVILQAIGVDILRIPGFQP